MIEVISIGTAATQAVKVSPSIKTALQLTGLAVSELSQFIEKHHWPPESPDLNTLDYRI